jgi:hypothetical protein
MEFPRTLQQLIAARDVEGIRAFMSEHNLRLDGRRIVPDDEPTKQRMKDLSGFWNQRQQARKILLNSLYGALLNEGLRFYDERLGQSVTLTGRSIVRHMNGKANEVITGKYDYTGDAIVYADTDSCYFTALPLKDDTDWGKLLLQAFAAQEQAARPEHEWVYHDFDFSNRSHMVRLYDDISEFVNQSFPEFMVRTFNTSQTRGAIIQAGRELVASAGLFIKKKKYAVLKYDEEGRRLDVDGKPGKLKAMGLDLKRADTPKFMQKFLEQTLMKLLTGVPKAEIVDDIREFREAFKSRPAWEKGSPKKVNGLSLYGEKLSTQSQIDVLSRSDGKKINMPGHVRASINWNRLAEVHGDRYATRINDGTRIVVCKLLPSPLKMDSVAYPIDEPHLPDWFKSLPFDHPAMEETIIDNKLVNLVGVLDWDLNETKPHLSDDFFTFR